MLVLIHNRQGDLLSTHYRIIDDLIIIFQVLTKYNIYFWKFNVMNEDYIYWEILSNNQTTNNDVITFDVHIVHNINTFIFYLIMINMIM